MRHGVPTARELTEAVREFLEEQVRPAVDGHLAFHLRVAANALAQVERELEHAPHDEAAHTARLRALGVEDDATLARAIRDGELDDRVGMVVRVLRRRTIERLRIANPRHLTDADASRHETS